MNEELIIDCKVWLVEDDEGEQSLKFSYTLPEIDSEDILEIYQVFFETLCEMIAEREGAAALVGACVEDTDEEEDRDNS